MEKYPMAFITAPGKIQIEQKTLLELNPDQVLVRVKFASICGSDLHLFKGKHPSVALPSAVGHELSGEVISIGSSISKISVGDRVTIEPVIACGKCHYCLRGKYHLCENISFQYRQGQGAFSTYFIASEQHVFRLPDSLSYEEGALVEPLSVALHAVKKSGMQLGNSCAVFGAGAIGLLTIMLANQLSQGKCFSIDIDDFRLQNALKVGASFAINNSLENSLEKIMQETGQLGVDFAFEAVGLAVTLEQALRSLRKGGLATVIGIFENPLPVVPVNLFIQKEITLSGSQGYNWDFQEAIALLNSDKFSLAPLITHRFPFDNLQEAFQMLVTPGNQAIKVLIEM